MSLSTLAIRRHIGTLMLALTVLLLGFFFLVQIPVDLLPSITYPRIGVRVTSPGIDPTVAVDEITRPLERALVATDGVEQVFSETREGQVSLDLYFRPGGDIDQALNDATASLNRALRELPAGLEPPRLFKFEPSQLPVYEFALSSPSLRDVELRVFADEELARELTVVPGVASVDVSGGVQEEVQVNLDLDRMQALGIGLNDVLDALDERNQDTAGGRLEGTDDETLTRTVGRFQNAAELENISFEAAGSLGFGTDEASPALGRVYLRDFAQVVDGTEEQRVQVNLNGQPAVKVSIQKQPEANTIEVVDGVKARLEFLRTSGLVPEDLVLTPTLDESVFIRNSISNVTSSGLTGALLAAIAVLFFLGSLRQTLIIVLAIPLASLTAIVLMGFFGLSLNIFSLGGLALGVGIVVDNAIVMLENMTRRFSLEAAYASSDVNGSTPPVSDSAIELATESSRELESALLASTTTNLVSVVPFLLLGGFFALLFNPLILTISFAVAASLLVALTVVPAIAARLLAVPRTSGISNRWLFREFRLRLEGVTRRYGQLLTRVLQHRWWVIAIAILILGGGSTFLGGQLPQEILPRINTGQAQLRVQFPPGTSLEENRKVMTAVDDLLLQQPEVAYVFSTSGGGLFGSSTSENILRASSTISLKPGTNLEAFVERMNREMAQFNLVDTRLRVTPENVRGLSFNNSPVRADIDIQLQGPDAETLQQAGQQVLAALDERVKLARFSPDADPPQPEVQVRPDWERASQLNLTAVDIGETVQTAIQGSVPTQLQRGDRLVDVRVQLANNRLQQPEQLRQLPLFTNGNQWVRLGDVARVEQGVAPGEIQRINQRQVFLIEGTLNEGAPLGDAIAQVNATIDSLELPQGVSRLQSASESTNREIRNALIMLGSLAAFLVFVVMAVQYNSLLDPLVIMLTVPLAVAGSIFGLYLTQTAIGAMVVVGAVLLVGIVVNNAIILIERANQVRETDGLDHRSAVLQAASERLRPILMTTITTVVGLFPLALGWGEGSEFLQPLGVVVFSGLSIATVLTLFLIPCFYIVVHEDVMGQGRLRLPKVGPQEAPTRKF
ncbi:MULTISPECIES: efflux RND transporter permease subunit [unclassified Leptolyngbya]|uniref:efflux RND transporter permease subunit n=1 Tax=unclassified Leptolyngbya TaxID=2650499 RepID=UPI001688919D|nr:MULTISPECIES: efflux RND transporter permease subunit [unclassified Leptolyngbya]MBD1910921.1 efflux RND transporter permease subunit [Leptolyngbya sp. FACHB-8]MBD2154966.1 efflux RND transporter permease subunit [Leptolyngbya sp. FACHB-16]